VTADFAVRRLETDDLDQYFDVRSQAFGLPGSARDEWKEHAAGAPGVVGFGGFRSGRLLGALRVIPGGQFVHGRSVPMGGIAGVVVRPEARGEGVARSLLAHAIGWMRERGIAVSSLHPASTRAYRSAGWELAGRAGWSTLPTRSLSGIRGDAAGPVEPLDPTGGREVQACYAAYAPSVPGAVDRSPGFWWLHKIGGRRDGAFLYGVRTDGALSGYIAYTQTQDEGAWGYSLRVDDVVAHDRASAVALWRFVGGHSMQVERVSVPTAALPALSLVLDEQDPVTDLENHWMHRIVDVPDAIAARGYPVGLAGSVVARITDPLAPTTAPVWRVCVADGNGAVEPAGDEHAEITVDVGALSALAIGGTTVGLLRHAGRIDGDAGAMARLGGLLQTPTPIITDEF
jgi:predicted acetyltransferase